MSSTEKTILKLNASGLKTVTCDYRAWLTMIEGYKTERQTSKIIYGIALHKFIDTMFQTGGHIGKAQEAAIKAFQKPKIDDKKSMHYSDQGHLIASAYDYWTQCISKDKDFETLLLPDGKPATEVTFSIGGYYEDEWLRVDLEGTIDRLGKIKNGAFVVDDWKSTSAWQEDTYLSHYAMSHQFRFYVLATKLMAQAAPDSVLGQIGATDLRYCIEGIFIKPKPIDNKYKRSDVFPVNDIHIFQRALDKQIRLFSGVIRELKEQGIEPLKQGLLNATCEGKWGMCSFWNVCKAQDPVIAKVLLERDFLKKPYDPLHHND